MARRGGGEHIGSAPLRVRPPPGPNEDSEQPGRRQIARGLGPYGVTRETLTCPTDAATARVVEKHGTSYHFSPVLQDETPVSVKIYSRRGTFNIENIGRLTIASDFQAVHPGKPIGLNVLKADGRVIQR